MTDRPDSVITNLNQITRLPNTDENGTPSSLKNKATNDENLVDQVNSTNEDNSITASKRPKSIEFI